MSDTLGILYELRACYSRFDERQTPYYRALSEAIETMHNLSKQRKGGKMTDTISILSEIRANYNCFDKDDEPYYRALSEAIEAVKAEPLTDVEQRIFLKAISREEEVCRKVDAEWGEGDEECEINLVHVCHEIARKVKGALWTI